MRNNKSIFKCAVYMGEESINIYSEDTRVIELLHHGNFIPFIPEWHIDKYEVKNRPILECVFSNEEIIEIKENGNSFISGQFKEFADSYTIPYFINYILEAERAKSGKVTIHSAAISKNNKGILLLGKQGSGKTSIALELCRKYGYSLVGNDLTLVGIRGNAAYLHGGTKVFRLRATTVKYYNSDLRKFFRSNENTDEWTQTTIINPEEIKVMTEKSVVPIQAIFYIHLYPPDYNFTVKEVDRLFSRIYLYQIFSEYIRGSAIIPLIGKDLKFSKYLPSLDNEIAFKKRIEFINWIINNRNYRYIAGSLINICTFIDQHL